MAAAWVVIVAGIVFILSTVFFACAVAVGISEHCYYRHHHGMMFRPGGPGGPWGPGPQYGGPWGSGMAPPFGPPPGFGPGGPSQTPTTSAPAPAPNAPGTPRP